MNSVTEPSSSDIFHWKTRDVKSHLVRHQFDIQDLESRALYNWWLDQETCPAKRSDFDILEHLHLAPRLYLYEFQEDGQIKYRLHGDTITILAGRQNAGRVFSEEDEDANFADLAKYLNHVAQLQKPSRCDGNLDFFGKDKIHFESLDLPLLDDAGQTRFILGLITTQDVPLRLL